MPNGRLRRSRSVAGKLGRLGSCLVLATGALLSGPVGQGRAAVSPSFVTRSGTQLLLDGQPFRFTGFNLYNANSDGWCNGETYTADQLRAAFDAMGSRNTVLRAWFFQPLAATKTSPTVPAPPAPPPTQRFLGDRDWTRFDNTLAIAREKGVHVIVTLTDQAGECGDGSVAGFKRPAWYQGGYLTPDPVETAQYVHWVSYYDWVTEVVSRYRDDPTILAWQLINEGEVTPSTGCPTGIQPPNPGYATDPSYIMKTWAQDVAGHIRHLETDGRPAGTPYHLISLGTLGDGQCGTEVWQYQTIHSVPEIDLCEYHDYRPEPMSDPSPNGLAAHIAQCNALGKPMFVGETGIIPATLPGGTLADRAELFDAKFRAQFAAGVQGELVWNYRRAGSALNSYDIGPGDPTLLRLQAWSPGCDPNDYRIAYTKEPPRGGPGSADLYILDPATGAQRRVTVDVDHGERTVSWAFDGSRLSYLTNGGSYVYSTDLRTVSVDGSGVTHLTGSTANPAFEPAWSPDGTRIAFVSNVPNLPQITLINPDGTGLAKLGPDPVNEAQDSPSWSPDGSRIAYVASWGGTGTVRTMRSDGTGQVSVLSGPGIRQVTWSPDGTKLAFTRDEFANGYQRAEIYLMNLDGTGQIKVTGALPNATFYQFSRPVWVSPSRLLFSSGDLNAHSDLYEINADGTGLANLTNTPTVDETDPAWRPARVPPVICAPEPPPPTVPGAPRNVTAVAVGPGSVDVAWDPPASNGGAELLDYRILANGTEVGAVTASETHDTIQGLAGGSYTFTVRTQNILGSGGLSAPSGPVVVAPVGVPPDAPTNVTAAAGDGVALVSWTAPGSPAAPDPSQSMPPAPNGSQTVTSYLVVASPGGASQVVSGDVTTVTVSGLANGTSYAFSVQGSNDFGPGAVSNPSIAVMPQAGAPAPQVASQSIGSIGGTVSTDSGSGATTADPTVTSVIVPAGAAAPAGTGTVTIAETAATVSPPSGGYQFVGQQVNITSSFGTSATNPLAIAFTIDESVLRSRFSLGPTDPLPAPTAVDVTRAEGGLPAVIAPCTSTGGGGLAIAPDPCVSGRAYVGTDLRITVLTSSASQWNAAIRPATVMVDDAGFGPATVTLAQGGVVRWVFGGSRPHNVRDDQKLGLPGQPLFDSGSSAAGSFGYVFLAAGTYSYRSKVPADGKFKGTVEVPVVVSPTSGKTTTTYLLTWVNRAMSGYVFDVEIRYQKPGANSWTPWAADATGTTATGGTWSASQGAGTYEVHARLRNLFSGRVSDWSPVTAISVAS